MTIKELATGMFGVDSNDEAFVIAGDKIIFEYGKYNDIDDLDENLMFDEESGIDALYEARCFQQVKGGRGKLIWKRPEPKVEEAKSEECEEGKITVTEDEFFEAVKKANEVWMEVAKKTPGDEVVNLVMGMQNMTFGSVIASILFGKEIN